MREFPRDIVWLTLTGIHKGFSVGTSTVRRYQTGFSPIMGFADQENGDPSPLAQFCEPGESFYSDGWIAQAPPGWTVEEESKMWKMIWDGRAPEPSRGYSFIELEARHAQQALELAQLTQPGPFGLRTLELGAYVGIFEGQRLIAMAGERLGAAGFREISGVCTHPDFQGRGLAKQLMGEIIRRQQDRGEVPFLHATSQNELARGLYQRMGFIDYHESTMRVTRREASYPFGSLGSGFDNGAVDFDHPA